MKFLCCVTKKAKNKKAASLGSAEFVRFELATIRSATANFSESNKLGEGGFGVVYKGTLKSGKEIAIKRLRYDIYLSTEVFMIESRVVARIQHTNLVRHLGFCSEGDEKLLVYEFLPNASLAFLLCDPSKRVQINWETWYKIILGIAIGLEYLHEGTHGRMLHYGLKTSNVLLDEEMNPKIADFGMNKLFHDTQQLTNTCSSVGSESSMGTFAYIAPEYSLSGRYSTKGDVYSFGVIVLEMLGDPKNGKSIQSRYEHYIQARKLRDEDRLLEFINPELSTRCSDTEVIRCIQVGLLCVQEDARLRPTMGEAVLMLTARYMKTDSLGNADLIQLDFATIRSATANFSVSNMLGQGQLGAVYKGTIKYGKKTALKRLRHDIDLSTGVFMAESYIVARIQRTNLVKRLGFCW